MKTPGLSRHLSSATLFLLLGLAAPAQETKPATSGAAALDLKRFDKDGDGMLDDAERAAAKTILMQEQAANPPAKTSAKSGRGAPDARRDRMVEMFDKNKDGRLDDEERAVAMNALTERGGRMRDALIQRFDKNGNGKLDDDEREAAQQFLKQRMGGAAPAASREVDEKAALEKVLRAAVEADAAQLQRFDQNKNGKLDDVEWTASRQKIVETLQSGMGAANPSGATESKPDKSEAKALRKRERGK